MSPRSTSQHLLQEQHKQQRALTLACIAQAMRQQGANDSTIRRALTGIHTYLTVTGTTSLHQPDQDLTQLPLLPDSTSSPPPPVTSLSDIPTQEPTWLWQQRIPRGALTLLDGDSHHRKTLLALHLAACISNGQPFSDGTPCQQGNVLLITPYHNISDTIHPQLQAAEADPHHLFLLNSVERLDPHTVQLRRRPFSLAHDLDLLEDSITHLQITLLILDTFEPLRPPILAALAQLAERTTCAILLLRPFGPPPNTSHDLLTALARSRLLLHTDPDDPDQALLSTSNPSLNPQPTTLIYLIPHNHSIPTIHYLAEQEDATTSADLLLRETRSYHRACILDVLHNSPTPLDARAVTDRVHAPYDNVRKTLQRMLHDRQVLSPYRGLYTTPDHPCLSQPINTSSIPNESHKPGETAKDMTVPPSGQASSHLLTTEQEPGSESSFIPLPLGGPHDLIEPPINYRASAKTNIPTPPTTSPVPIVPTQQPTAENQSEKEDPFPYRFRHPYYTQKRNEWGDLSSRY